MALKWKFISCSHCQDDLKSDWLFTLELPIRSQLIVDPTLDNDYNLKIFFHGKVRYPKGLDHTPPLHGLDKYLSLVDQTGYPKKLHLNFQFFFLFSWFLEDL